MINKPFSFRIVLFLLPLFLLVFLGAAVLFWKKLPPPSHTNPRDGHSESTGERNPRSDPKTPGNESRPDGILADPSEVGVAESKGTYGERVLRQKEQVLKLLTKLYFSEENADFAALNQPGKFAARLKELQETLEGLKDPAALAAVLLIVSEHSSAVNSIKRLEAEFQRVVRGSPTLSKDANLKEFAAFALDYIAKEDLPTNVRTFSASALTYHTLDFRGRRLEDIPESAYKLDREQLNVLSDVLKRSFSPEKKAFSQQLLTVSSPYMGISDPMRQAFVQLVTTAPADPDLRLGLVLALKGQKWPVYEIQPLFDFMMASLDPKFPSLMTAVTQSFGDTALPQGDDPRAKTYFDRLSAAYGSLSERKDPEAPDRRQEIIYTVAVMDVPGAPALTKAYLTDAGVPSESKEEVLRRMLVQATGKNQSSYYRKTGSELIAMLRDAGPSFVDLPKVRKLAEDCIQTLSR